MAVVLITGCSSGFGKLAAVAFAKRGDTGVRDDAQPRRLGAVARRGERLPASTIEVLQLDVTDKASVDAAVADVIEKRRAASTSS